MIGETAEHLPATELEARLAQDAPDVAALVRMLDLRTPEVGAGIHRQQLPHSNTKTRVLMEGALGKRASTPVP